MLPLAPGRERAAAEPADRGVELGHAGLDRGQRVGLAGAAGVVEVHADRRCPGQARRTASSSWTTRSGVVVPIVSPRQSWSAPGGDRGPRDVDGAGDRGAAVERAVPRGGDDDLERAAGAVREPRRSRRPRRPPRPWSGRRWPGCARRRRTRRTRGSRTPASTARDGAAGVGDQGRPVHAAPAGQLGGDLVGVGERGHGLRRDERRRLDPPDAGGDERLEHLQLASSGTGSSSCRPSRMPTSRMSTAVGSTRSNSFTRSSSLARRPWPPILPPPPVPRWSDPERFRDAGRLHPGVRSRKMDPQRYES